MNGFKNILVMLILPICISCIPMGGSSGALICQTDGGDSVNVREIYGTWKMIDGYTDGTRTEEELENDYDVLVVQTGGGICRVGYVSQSPIETVMLGIYQHDVSSKNLDLSLSIPYDFETSAKYSFAGTCGESTMTLRYGNGAVERYMFRGKDTGSGCPFDSE